MKNKEHRIVILGGGFAGLKCALSLSKKDLPEGTKIILISDRPHFEYHGALYRIATGHSPLEVCLPLSSVLDERKVEIVEDRITKIVLDENCLHGESGSKYRYDDLVIGLGAETVFFNIPGMQEYAHGIKTINDALKLKRHMHEVFAACSDGTSETKLCSGHFVVVGAGATGVEIAAEIMIYAKRLAKKHDIDPSLIRVDLIEAQSRILPTLDEKFACAIHKKLTDLGVTILTDTRVTKSDISSVHLTEMELKTKTVVWTAGVRGNILIEEAGLETDKRGHAVVCGHLRATKDGQCLKNIYVAGDAANTELSGMAQTALQDGMYIADTIARSLRGEKPKSYRPLQSIYAVPAGPGWAGAYYHGMRFYGKVGWFIRRVVDMVVFLAFLPPLRALQTFRAHKIVSED